MPQINNFLSNLSIVNNEIDLIDLVNKIGKIHQENQEEIKISSTNARKFHGIYYTSFEVASTIVKEALKLNNKPLFETKVFEPCVGIGIFLITYLNEVFTHHKVDKIDIQKTDDFCASVDICYIFKIKF